MKNFVIIFFVLTGIILSQQNNFKRNSIKLGHKNEHKFTPRKNADSNSFDKIEKLSISDLFPTKILLNKTEKTEGYVSDFIIMQWNKISSKWENSEHYINTYDDQFNEIESIYQIWDIVNSRWTNLERYTSEYDENGNWISYLREDWNINQWINYFLYSTTYNLQNLITEDLLQIWNDVSSKWENYIIYKYEYDNNWDNTSYLRQDWNFNSSIWENVWKHIGQFNDNLLSHDLFQEWKNVWQNSTLTEYNYDANRNVTEQTIKFWLDNSTWENSSYHMFVYDKNNNNTEYYYNYWNDTLSTWITWYRDLYTYDENNNQISYFSEDWNNLDSVWINYEQAFFSYNDQGILISEVYQSWDSYISDWVNTTKIVYDITQTPSGVNTSNHQENVTFQLEQNYPNPFNPATIIKYSLPAGRNSKMYN